MQITIEAESIRELDEILQRITVLEPVKTPDPIKDDYDVRKDRTATPKVKTAEPEKRKYSKVDANDIYRLKKAGKTAKEIADELGCSYSTVCKKLNEVF